MNTTSELRTKLRAKLLLQKSQRASKEQNKLQRQKSQKVAKLQNKKQDKKKVENDDVVVQVDTQSDTQIDAQPDKQIDSSEDARLIYDVRNMMADVANLKGMPPVHKAQKLSKKYVWLHEAYFSIYRATAFGEMRLDMLAMMLRQRRQIDTTHESLEKASQEVGAVLAKEYNVDLVKLEKDMKDKYGVAEAEKQ